MPAFGVQDYVVSEHALFEMRRRAVSETIDREVMVSPEQRIEIRPGRIILQSRVWRGEPAKQYLLRVFVDIDRRPAEVVTVYPTSKIGKYWRAEP